MSPRIASSVFFLGIIALLYLDRDRRSKTTPAIWIAVIWVFLGASRMASQWLGFGGALNSPDQYLEGSPLDAALLTTLLGCGLAVLVVRRQQVLKILSANPYLLLFFVYCIVSASWSDFPVVAIKRWTKFLGNVVMVLVVLTDRDPLLATKRLFTRAGFLLIPISVLFCKYYPELGRGYNRWNWTTFYTGASTDKNGLGAICLIFGLASVWQFRDALRDKSRPGRNRSLLAHGTILALNIFLLKLANSSTSTACFLLGTVLILATMRTRKLKPAMVHMLVGLTVSLGLLSYIFDDVYASLIHALGRQADLTGRTDLWNDVLQFNVNPIVGTGFESFWLGRRAEFFWNRYPFHPNQAHNGYIEVYLNLGWIGVILLGLVIIAGYANVIRAFRASIRLAPLKLCLLIVAVVYNMTEAAFKVIHPVFIAFLFAVIAVPEIRTRRIASAPATWTADDRRFNRVEAILRRS
jgi:O-antigen ligase